MRTKGILSLALAGALMTSFATMTSCNKVNDELKDAPVVTLEKVSEDLTSVSFRISATNAAEVAYLLQDNLSSVPSAKGIMSAGVKVSAAKAEEITLDECTPGEQYFVTAAAVSENGTYSEVATLTLTAAGTNCTFEIDVISALDNSLSYTVTPSDDEVAYLTSALPAAKYGEASDEEIFTDIMTSVSSSAEAAGQSLAGYLADNANKGQKNIVMGNLEPETSYVVVAVGVDAEGLQSTPIARTTATTVAEIPELEFTLSVTDITAYSANLTVTPSNNSSHFVWIYKPAASFPDIPYPSTPEGMSQEDANNVAEMHLEGQRQWLDQGMGLSTGNQNYNVPLSSDTKYYLFAFAYEPGLGRQSDCKVYAFETLHGFAAEEFDVNVDVTTITSTFVEFSVTPKDDGMNGIYWGSVTVPKSDYKEGDAIAYVDNLIQEYTDTQIEAGNVNYSRADALSSLVSSYQLSLGPEEYLTYTGLTPDTDYVLAIVPVNSDGSVTQKVILYDFRTLASSVGGPSCNLELVGMYNADEVAELGIFPDFTPQYKDAYYVAAFKVTKGESASYVQYASNMGGDFTDPEGDPEGYYSDDWYLGLLQWTEIPQEDFDENGVAYIFLLQVYYNYFENGIFGNKITTIAIAKDDNDVWGKSGRVFYYANDTNDEQLGDVNELKALVDGLNGAKTKALR